MDMKQTFGSLQNLFWWIWNLFTSTTQPPGSIQIYFNHLPESSNYIFQLSKSFIPWVIAIFMSESCPCSLAMGREKPFEKKGLETLEPVCVRASYMYQCLFRYI